MGLLLVALLDEHRELVGGQGLERVLPQVQVPAGEVAPRRAANGPRAQPAERDASPRAVVHDLVLDPRFARLRVGLAEGAGPGSSGNRLCGGSGVSDGRGKHGRSLSGHSEEGHGIGREHDGIEGRQVGLRLGGVVLIEQGDTGRAGRLEAADGDGTGDGAGRQVVDEDGERVALETGVGIQAGGIGSGGHQVQAEVLNHLVDIVRRAGLEAAEQPEAADGPTRRQAELGHQVHPPGQQPRQHIAQPQGVVERVQAGFAPRRARPMRIELGHGDG